jgi:hypothetical protein
MNERIEKISEQARQYADSMYPSGLDIAKWGPAYQEKFAELIVAECANSLWTEECHNSDLALEEFERNSAKIKEHFGVEE